LSGLERYRSAEAAPCRGDDFHRVVLDDHELLLTAAGDVVENEPSAWAGDCVANRPLAKVATSKTTQLK
jgi:hypothetical protein